MGRIFMEEQRDGEWCRITPTNPQRLEQFADILGHPLFPENPAHLPDNVFWSLGAGTAESVPFHPTVAEDEDGELPRWTLHKYVVEVSSGWDERVRSCVYRRA